MWLAVQVNPGIPLFASMFEAAPRLGPPSTAPDLAATLLAGSAQRVPVARASVSSWHCCSASGATPRVPMLLLIGAALLVKGVAAAMLLKPAAWQHWLSPGVSMGVAAGTLLLSMAIWLPRPAQVALATIALLSSLLATLFVPDLVYARAPLALFDWTYGQLLNFNGLTHAVLLAWPARRERCFLVALAGRPGWGEPR